MGEKLTISHSANCSTKMLISLQSNKNSARYTLTCFGLLESYAGSDHTPLFSMVFRG